MIAHSNETYSREHPKTSIHCVDVKCKISYVCLTYCLLENASRECSGI